MMEAFDFPLRKPSPRRMHQIWNTSTRCNTEKLGIIACNGMEPWISFWKLSSKLIGSKISRLIRNSLQWFGKKNMSGKLSELVVPFGSLKSWDLPTWHQRVCFRFFSSKKTDLRTSSPSFNCLGHPNHSRAQLSIRLESSQKKHAFEQLSDRNSQKSCDPQVHTSTSDVFLRIW